MRDTARRRDCVALAVWAHSDLPLTTIRVLLGERGEMTQKETEAEVSGWCDTTCTTVRSWVLNPSPLRRRCHRSATRALRRPSVLRPGVPCDSARVADRGPGGAPSD
jgi:hypothetical protein